MHNVVVQLADGTSIASCERYDVTIDMLAPGSPWTITVLGSSGQWDRVYAQALLGARLSLSIDGIVQLDGVIRTRHSADRGREGTSLTLSGRDLASVAQECDADPTTQLRDTTVAEAVDRLIGTLGIPVFHGAGVEIARTQATRRRRGAQPVERQKRLPALKVRLGDRRWALADAIARRAGYLLWSGPNPVDPTGFAAILDQPDNTSPAVYTLERRRTQRAGEFTGNILSGDQVLSLEEIPTMVVSYAHTPLSAAQDTHQRVAIPNTGLAHPLVAPRLPPCERYVHDVRAHTLAEAQNVGDRVIAAAMAQFITYECTVQSHGQTFNGGLRVLFAVNRCARVVDELWGIDEVMLLTRVQFRGHRGGGQTTELRMVPRGAIQVFPDDLSTPVRRTPRLRAA